MSPASGKHAAPPAAIREKGAILLVSCYELGQQPLGLVVPAAVLERAGFSPALMDVSVEPFDEVKAASASLVGISVPMHTALRLGVRAAERVRELNPDCHIVFFGIYAELNATHLLDTVADSCLGAEFEQGLVELAASLERGAGGATGPEPGASDRVGASRPARGGVPGRDGLPPLDRYVKFVRDGVAHRVGYVATTRGCKHACLHCPLPAVYHGRFYALPVETVLEDIRQLAEAGAAHITFADPDFLNGPSHAIRVATAMHDRFPSLTFDYTAKVEHLSTQRDTVRRLQALGCAFVVSAVESLSDRTLAVLRKGHTRRDALDVIRLFRGIGLTLRPSFVPFTPWDTISDYRALLDLVESEELVDHVDPVQWGIRLLVPPGSLLLAEPAMQRHLGSLDEAGLTYRWRHPDARMDRLQRAVARRVESAAAASEDPAVTFFAIKRLASEAASTAGGDLDEAADVARRYPADRPRPPRLTEDWFC